MIARANARLYGPVRYLKRIAHFLNKHATQILRARCPAHVFLSFCFVDHSGDNLVNLSGMNFILFTAAPARRFQARRTIVRRECVLRRARFSCTYRWFVVQLDCRENVWFCEPQINPNRKTKPRCQFRGWMRIDNSVFDNSWNWRSHACGVGIIFQTSRHQADQRLPFRALVASSKDLAGGLTGLEPGRRKNSRSWAK